MTLLGVIPSEGVFVDALRAPTTRLGPVEYTLLPCAFGQELPCVANGLFLGYYDGAPVAWWLRSARQGVFDNTPDMALTALAGSEATGQRVLGDLFGRLESVDPYRGAAVRLRGNRAGGLGGLDFLDRPQFTARSLVVPTEVVQVLDGHAVAVSRRAERMRAAGLPVKRGLLLHGRPGTGKTHAARYLAAQLPEAALVVLTSDSLAHLRDLPELLRGIGSAIVLLDDVDLIARSRDIGTGSRAALFDLLAMMDDVPDAADVLFVLTTNRPDEVEAALAERPGRVDRVVEIPLPDPECRRRLVDIYRQGLVWTVTEPELLVRRTAGVAASFFPELLRRAWLISREQQVAGVDDAVIAQALDELLPETT